MELINDLILQAAASPWLPLVLFTVTVIDGFFPPVPSETVLVAAAAVAATAGSWPTVLLLCLAAALGALLGDTIAYAIGRRVGVTRFRWMRGDRVSKSLARARTALGHRGAAFIIGARFIPVGRVAVNMSAGALRYPWRRFLPVSAVAAATWAAYSAAIGVLAGQWLADQPLLSAVVGIVFALVIGVAIDRIAAARRQRQDARAGAGADAGAGTGADAAVSPLRPMACATAGQGR